MSFRTKDDLIGIGEHSKTVSIEAWWCDSEYCDEGILDGPALAKREAVYTELQLKRLPS
jgi:hypothetical protein